MDDEVFVLLDDCHATDAAPTSRLYSAFVREHRCTDPQTLDAVWQAVTAEQHEGLHAVVFADYEWGSKLQQAGLQQVAADDGSALRVLLFRSLEQMSAEAAAHWLARQDGSEAPSPAGIGALQPSVGQPRFEADIARIHALIRCGETYQINYTFRIQGSAYGTPTGLYRRLRAMQPVAFGVLARLPDVAGAAARDTGDWVLSCSPELFVRHGAGQLTARPMKGTAARLDDVQLDRQRADWLAGDAKNRAENVMIVDLLRNDLGRISDTGSVTVPKLFAVETYKTVHQMTSTVTSTLRAGVGFPEVLRALFPCGSITGAPKLHSMDLIAGLETGPRGLYCGAIGWVDAPKAHAAVGDFCLSVAIRTLVLGCNQDGRRSALLGVGNGIVMDSDATEEFAETRTKTRYLRDMDPGFTLFETLGLHHGRLRHLQQHLQRLQASAQALGFACDAAALQAALQGQAASLDPGQSWRLRLDLQHDGQFHLQHSALTKLDPGPARLLLSASPVPAAQAVLLNHKTSLRSAYDAAIQQAVAQGGFDAIFVNAQGEVTEGARSTLLIQRDGRWWTPALSSGVLPGVLRQRLLRRYPQIGERVLLLEELLSAQSMVVCSSLRGLQHAAWLRDANGQVLRT